MHEARFAEDLDRATRVRTQVCGDVDRRRAGDDDERTGVGLQCCLECPVGNWTPADDGQQLVLTTAESPPGAPCEEDEGGRGSHPRILPDFPADPVWSLSNKGFSGSMIITI